MKRNHRILPILVGLASLASLAPLSRATTLFYDGFDYTAGTNLSANGWSKDGAAANFPITSGSLDYPGIVSVGNKLTDNASSGTMAAFKPMGVDLTTYTAAGQTQWFSLLASVSSLSGNNQMQVRFFSGGAFAQASGYGVGVGYNGTSAFVSAVGDNGATAGSTFTTGLTLDTTILVIGRATWTTNTVSGTTGTATGSISLWVNPADFSSESSLGTASLVRTGVTFVGNQSSRPLGDRVVIQGGSTYQGSVDEIRLGTTFADVTAVPEPSSFALLVGVGCLLLIVHRRYRVAS